MLVDLLHVVRSLLQVYADRAVHDEAEALIAIEQHDAVYRALVAGDEDAAASAMAVHMATASARLSADVAARRLRDAPQSGKTTPFVRMKHPQGCGSRVWTTA